MSIDSKDAQKIRVLLDKWGSTLYFVKMKEREIAWFNEMKTALYDVIGAHTMSEDIVTHSSTSSGVERAVEQVEERLYEYHRAIQACHDAIINAMRMKNVIDEFVDEFDSDTRDILRMRYVDRHQWAFIALKMSYDERTVRRKESAAVEKLSVNVRWNVL